MSLSQPEEGEIMSCSEEDASKENLFSHVIPNESRLVNEPLSFKRWTDMPRQSCKNISDTDDSDSDLQLELEDDPDINLSDHVANKTEKKNVWTDVLIQQQQKDFSDMISNNFDLREKIVCKRDVESYPISMSVFDSSNKNSINASIARSNSSTNSKQLHSKSERSRSERRNRSPERMTLQGRVQKRSKNKPRAPDLKSRLDSDMDRYVAHRKISTSKSTSKHVRVSTVEQRLRPLLRPITDEDSDAQVARAISYRLMEQKVHVMHKVVEVLGRKKALEILARTVDIEETGGLSINNEKRRRTPGGVFLVTMKECPGVTEEQCTEIFRNENKKNKTKKRQKARARQRDKWSATEERRFMDLGEEVNITLE